MLFMATGAENGRRLGSHPVTVAVAVAMTSLNGRELDLAFE